MDRLTHVLVFSTAGTFSVNYRVMFTEQKFTIAAGLDYLKLMVEVEPPDVVIVDITLPQDTRAAEAIAWLEANNPSIPVIVLINDLGLKDPLYNRNIAATLSHPVEEPVLRNAVAMAVSRAQS